MSDRTPTEAETRVPCGAPHRRRMRWVDISDRIVTVLVHGVGLLVGGVVLAVTVLTVALLVNPLGVRTPIRELELSELGGSAPPCSGPIEVRLLGSITLDDAAKVTFAWAQDDLRAGGSQDRYYSGSGTFGFDLGMVVVRPAPGKTAGFISLAAGAGSMVDDGPVTSQLSWRCQTR